MHSSTTRHRHPEGRKAGGANALRWFPLSDETDEAHDDQEAAR